MNKLKLMTIIGTRPEIIRLSAVIKKCDVYFDQILVHTGQNYDYNLNQVFFEDLGLRAPNFYLDAVGKDLGETIERKILLVSRFIDILIYTRAVNYRSMDYSTIKYAMFQLTKRIRNLCVDELAAQLGKEVADLGMSIEGAWGDFRLNFYTKKYIRHMLARITDYVERGCDQPGHYLEYVAVKSKRPFEVEHIITDHFEWYQDEYGSREEFEATRNRPGNLLLLDKSTNASINDDRYPDKLPVYGSEKGNVLSAALVAGSYQHNPRFLKFMGETGFEFKPYDEFGREQIAERSGLVGALVLALWSPDFGQLAVDGLAG